MRRSALLLIPLLALQGQQQPPGALILLERSDHALDTYHTFQFELSSTLVMARPGEANRRSELSGVVFGTNAGAWHIQLTSAAGMDTTVVSDGRAIWTYNHGSNTYTQEYGGARLFGLLARAGVSATPAIVRGTAGAVREETINVDGEPHECWVVETTPPPPWMQTITTWIDKKTRIDWRIVTEGRIPDGPNLTATIQKSKLILNPGLPDSVFIFTPPPGAQQRAIPAGVH